VSWQGDNIKAAAAFLRERIAAGDTTPRTRAIYEGLLDVLDPTRRATRVQRELHDTAKKTAAAAIKAERERRAKERRQADRRKPPNLGSPTGVERRRAERRSGRDRRNR